MSEHLPECHFARPGISLSPCICDRLRACEARVRASEFTLGTAVGKHDGFLEGYAAGLSAAREAVRALRGVGSFVDGEGNVVSRAHAITAIDTLTKTCECGGVGNGCQCEKEQRHA